MNRRQFVIASASAAVSAVPARAATAATILYADRSVVLDDVRDKSGELWVRSADLPRINGFELKPEGACRADMCVPIPKGIREGPWFNLTGFAQKLGEVFIVEERFWSFGEIPALRNAFLNSRIAPDFAVPDRANRIVHLSDFKGKKVFIVTWASW